MQELIGRATSVPLVIIDWISSSEEHGEKVRSVVDYLLHEFGLSLPITLIDLNPTHSRRTLSPILSEFEKEYYCPKMGIDCGRKEPSEVTDARKWIAGRHSAEGGVANVNQLVLEALLWKYFHQERAWVNMSFSIDSLSLQILQADFLATSHSFGISAANDDRLPESPVGVPQRAASVYTNFVNVTYATREGVLLGGETNPLYSVIVTAAGQGCGFDFEHIRKSDEGTSFASPYVAAVSWIKYLIDGVDETRMRKALVDASSVAATPNQLEIESAGIFDPARLLLKQPTSIVAMSDGSEKTYASIRLTLRYKKHDGSPVQEDFKTGEGTAITFVRIGAILKARVRRMRTSQPPIPVTDTEEFEVVSATLQTSDREYITQDLGSIVLSIFL